MSTVVLDCNLREPMIAERTRVKKAPGLSNVLTGQCCLEDAVRHLPVGLDILPAGDPPSNPSELLASLKFSAVIKELEAMYEIVILDAPSVCDVTDALILSREVDGTVFVIGNGISDHKGVCDAMDKLKLTQTPLLGLVYNGVGRVDKNS